MDHKSMSQEEVEAYMRHLQHLNELQVHLSSTSPLLAALISSTIPQSGVAAAFAAHSRSASAASSAATNSIPEEEELPISASAPTTSPTVPDMATVSGDQDFYMRLLAQLLQQQAATAVSTAASMPNLMSIGSLPFAMPQTTVPSTDYRTLAGLSLFSSAAMPSANNYLEQQLAFQSSLMRPRVNSAASSSTSSSSLSSPNPTSSPERRRKRARSLLIKAEEAAAKLSQDAKTLKRSDVLAEMIEDEQQRRELAASVMAASANGTLTTLKSTSPATKGLLEDFPKITLRPLIPEAALPETVGPDSPYRHHPKYQKKAKDAAMDFSLGQSFASLMNKDKKDGEDSGTSSTSSSLSSLQGNPEALKMMLNKFMDDVISGELVASN